MSLREAAGVYQQKQKQQLTWPDKHKPSKFSDIIGASDYNSSVKNLLNWLHHWHSANVIAKTKEKKSNKKNKQTAANDSPNCKNNNNNNNNIKSNKSSSNEKFFRAVLISGPSGVGKTTCAQLACKEAGYSLIEFNASNSRSKKRFSQILSECTTSNTLSSFVLNGQLSKQQKNVKRCILMDELDGMDGCVDRGGIAELIAHIKQTKIPIICICNDKSSKLKSLAAHCLELRFGKPRLELARARLTSICQSECVNISPQAIEQVIVGCDHDMRQCLTNLCVWSCDNKAVTRITDATIQGACKDTRVVSLFESCARVFRLSSSSSGSGSSGGSGIKNSSKSSSNNNSMQEKSDRFFDNYSLMPLFVQENYLLFGPSSRRFVDFNTISDSCQSMCTADRLGKQMRSSSNWSLLPSQATFATVIPGTLLASNNATKRLNFPAWLGKNSTQNKHSRELQDLQKRTRLFTGGVNKTQLACEYMSVFRRLLTDPLINSGEKGIAKTLRLMNAYGLTRQDFDTIESLASYASNASDQRKTAAKCQIAVKVKAAFTRAYNNSLCDKKSKDTISKNKKQNSNSKETIEENEDDFEDENDMLHIYENEMLCSV